MTTIIIADGITATMSFAKVELYRKAIAATEASRSVLWDEHFDWSDWEEFWADEFEAWERFINS